MIEIKSVSHPEGPNKGLILHSPAPFNYWACVKGQPHDTLHKIWRIIRTSRVRIWHTSTMIIHQFPLRLLAAPEILSVEINVLCAWGYRHRGTMFFKTIQSWQHCITREEIIAKFVDLSWTQTGSMRFLVASRSILFNLSSMTTFSEVWIRIKFPVDYWSRVFVGPRLYSIATV